MPTFGLQVWGKYSYAKERAEILLICMYAVAIKKGTEVVGHVPRKMSAACSLFLRLGGVLHCEIIDSHRRYSSDLP